MSTYEVTASIVDVGLPELGPVASRTVAVAAAPGGIAGAVSTALGFMRIQAMQNDLLLTGAAVVCENSLQREIVADALADTESEPVLVVDIFDDRLTDRFAPDVAVALLVGQVAVAAPTRVALPDRRRSVWPVAAVAVAVLAALGGVTAWAMTSQTPARPAVSVPAEAVYPSVVPPSSLPLPPPVVESSVAVPAPEVQETEEIVVVPTPVYVPPVVEETTTTVRPAPTVVPTTVAPTTTTTATTTTKPPPETTTTSSSSSSESETAEASG